MPKGWEILDGYTSRLQATMLHQPLAICSLYALLEWYEKRTLARFNTLILGVAYVVINK